MIASRQAPVQREPRAADQRPTCTLSGPTGRAARGRTSGRTLLGLAGHLPDISGVRRGRGERPHTRHFPTDRVIVRAIALGGNYSGE
jgi:hypothetical protein